MPRTEISLMLDEQLLEVIDREIARKEFEDGVNVSRSELINQILSLAYELEAGPDSKADLLTDVTDLNLIRDIPPSRAAVVPLPDSTGGASENTADQNTDFSDTEQSDRRGDDDTHEIEDRYGIALSRHYKPEEYGISPEIFHHPQQNRTESSPLEKKEPSEVQEMIAADLANIKESENHESS